MSMIMKKDAEMSMIMKKDAEMSMIMKKDCALCEGDYQNIIFELEFKIEVLEDHVRSLQARLRQQAENFIKYAETYHSTRIEPQIILTATEIERFRNIKENNQK